MFRVAVIGARRRRQGLGAFIARAFARLGVEVTAVVGTTAATAREAAEALQADGIRARPYSRLESCLEETALDAVAVCSPYEAHADHVRAVGAAGLHCLVEKPFCWADTPAAGRRLTQLTRELIEPFGRNRRHLRLVTQWPETLPAYHRLQPQAAGAPVDRFFMRLSPISHGPAMVLDSCSHPISLLQAVAGPGIVEDPRVAFEGPERERCVIDLTWRHDQGAVAAALELVRTPEIPRPAGYGLNGNIAWRVVREPGYRTFFVAAPATREVEVPDPLAALVERFVDDAARGAPTAGETIVNGMEALERLHTAATTAWAMHGHGRTREHREVEGNAA